jgi:hypothetical protein
MSDRRPDPTAAREERRITFAAVRAADHAARELALLAQASQVHDDRSRRELEIQAGIAHLYSIAISEEHELRR